MRRTRCLVRTVPWCDSCRCDSILQHMAEGISRRHLYAVKLSSIVRCSRAFQLGLHDCGSWPQWSGKPCSITSCNCWYSGSFTAWYWTSYNFKLSWISMVMALSFVIDKKAGSLCASNSARVSSLRVSDTGLRDTESGASLTLPLIHFAVKLRICH